MQPFQLPFWRTLSTFFQYSLLFFAWWLKIRSIEKKWHKTVMSEVSCVFMLLDKIFSNSSNENSLQAVGCCSLAYMLVKLVAHSQSLSAFHQYRFNGPKKEGMKHCSFDSSQT